MTGPRSAIAERIKLFLVPPLHPVVDARVEEGLRKYGQTLDDNVKPERAKAVHQLQELLDAMNYRAWRTTDSVGDRPGNPDLAEHAQRRQDLDLSHLARMANDLVRTEFPDLTLEEMLYREGHSGQGQSAATGRPDPDGLKRSEAPFTFPGGTVPVPVLRDVQTGTLYYSADTVHVMFNLKHYFSPPAGTADALLRQWWAADQAVDAAEIALRRGQPDAAELFLKAEAAMVAADDAIRTHFAGGGS